MPRLGNQSVHGPTREAQGALAIAVAGNVDGMLVRPQAVTSKLTEMFEALPAGNRAQIAACAQPPCWSVAATFSAIVRLTNRFSRREVCPFRKDAILCRNNASGKRGARSIRRRRRIRRRRPRWARRGECIGSITVIRVRKMISRCAKPTTKQATPLPPATAVGRTFQAPAGSHDCSDTRGNAAHWSGFQGRRHHGQGDSAHC